MKTDRLPSHPEGSIVSPVRNARAALPGTLQDSEKAGRGVCICFTCTGCTRGCTDAQDILANVGVGVPGDLHQLVQNGLNCIYITSGQPRLGCLRQCSDRTNHLCQIVVQIPAYTFTFLNCGQLNLAVAGALFGL